MHPCNRSSDHKKSFKDVGNIPRSVHPLIITHRFICHTLMFKLPNVLWRMKSVYSLQVSIGEPRSWTECYVSHINTTLGRRIISDLKGST